MSRVALEPGCLPLTLGKSCNFVPQYAHGKMATTTAPASRRLKWCEVLQCFFAVPDSKCSLSSSYVLLGGETRSLVGPLEFCSLQSLLVSWFHGAVPLPQTLHETGSLVSGGSVLSDTKNLRELSRVVLKAGGWRRPAPVPWTALNLLPGCPCRWSACPVTGPPHPWQAGCVF